MLSELIAHGPVVRALDRGADDSRLAIMPISAGYEQRRGPAYDWHGLKRGKTPFTILQYTIAGAGRLDFEGRMLRIGPGEAMVLTVPHDHRYWLADGEDWEFFWLSLRGAEAIRLHEIILSRRGPVVSLGEGTADALAGLCLDLINGDPPSSSLASALAYRSQMLVLDGLFGIAGEAASSDSPVARALRHIESNLGDRLDVDRLAEVAGLSRAHFSRQFTAMTGTGPAEHVFMARMRLAARLLASEGETDIVSIAARCGFSDGNYFSKAFRRHFGFSPSAYRAQLTPDDPARPPPEP